MLKREDPDGVAAPAAKRKQRGKSEGRDPDDSKKAAPAAKAKGRADKQPAAPAPSGGAADDRKPCYFLINAGRDRGKECRFKRIMPPKGERQGLVRKRSPPPQPKAKARGRDAASPAPKAKAKAEAKSAGRARGASPRPALVYCHAYASDAGCSRAADCKCPRIAKSTIERVTPKPKGKAAAKPAAVAFPVPCAVSRKSAALDAWIIDTGSGLDLISAEQAKAVHAPRVVSRHEVSLAIANGTTTSRMTAALRCAKCP